MNSVSLIIITLNEGESLQQTVDNLRTGLPEGSEIIVVDDGSTDESTAFLEGGYPDVTLLRSTERLGVPRARNLGAEHATGDVLVFSDAHVLAGPGWLEPLLRELECAQVGAVAPAIAALSPASVEASGYGQKWSDASLGVQWLPKYNDEAYPVPLLCGCFLAMRREVFEAVGGFDGGLVLWGAEDSELSIRLWTAGYQCRVVPEVVVQHQFRQTFPYAVNWEPILHNRLRLATVHFSQSRLRLVLEGLKHYQDFPAAMARLLSGDVAAQRAAVSALRRFDDDWLFSKFRHELNSDLAGAGPLSVNVSDAPRVTACLLSWKRPQNLPLIVRSLRRTEFIDEILIWNNNPELKLDIPESDARIIESPENQSCYGRFLCAAQARNPIVYVQDDDALNHDLPGLYAQFLRDPSRITHALAATHWRHRSRRNHGDAQLALIGWGAFFPAKWVSVLDDVAEELRDSALFRREADAFFSLLLQRRHNAVPGHIAHLDDHSTPGIALWCDDGNQRFTSLAIRESLRLLRLKKNPGSHVPWNIVVTCHNYGRFLRESIHSILASDADYEVHIVDDASRDETPEIAAELTRLYPHVHYLRNQQQRGPAYSRNRGVAAIDSSFVVLLDADDMIGPDYLFEAGRKLSAGADVVNPDAILFGDAQATWAVPDVATLDMLLERNPVHCCSAFRRHFWAASGGIDEQIPCWEDYHFWIRVAAAGARIVGLHGNHFFHRRHEDSLSCTRDSKQARFLEYVRQHDSSLFERLSGRNSQPSVRLIA